jgi:hypothetical protein
VGRHEGSATATGRCPAGLRTLGGSAFSSRSEEHQRAQKPHTRQKRRRPAGPAMPLYDGGTPEGLNAQPRGTGRAPTCLCRTTGTHSRNPIRNTMACSATRPVSGRTGKHPPRPHQQPSTWVRAQFAPRSHEPGQSSTRANSRIAPVTPRPIHPSSPASTANSAASSATSARSSPARQHGRGQRRFRSPHLLHIVMPSVSTCHRDHVVHAARRVQASCIRPTNQAGAAEGRGKLWRSSDRGNRTPHVRLTNTGRGGGPAASSRQPTGAGQRRGVCP